MKMKLGSADWNLWPISTDYETTFTEFKRSGISNLELGIYTPSIEFTKEKRQRISQLAAIGGIEITAALSRLPQRTGQTAHFQIENQIFYKNAQFSSSTRRLRGQICEYWTGADLPDGNLEETKNTLIELNKIANEFSGVVSIEYKADTIFPNGIVLANLLTDLDNLKVLIDTGHAFALEENVVELIRDLHDRNLLGAMHLGDAIAGDSDADLPCGRVHDFTPIFEALTEIDFEATANFDLYGAAVDENGPGPMNILEESLNHVKKVMMAGT
jgi:sugar phosphate isomerase/epimerase